MGQEEELDLGHLLSPDDPRSDDVVLWQCYTYCNLEKKYLYLHKIEMFVKVVAGYYSSSCIVICYYCFLLRRLLPRARRMPPMPWKKPPMCLSNHHQRYSWGTYRPSIASPLKRILPSCFRFLLIYFNNPCVQFTPRQQNEHVFWYLFSKKNTKNARRRIWWYW